jgi:hypothetical protein
MADIEKKAKPYPTDLTDEGMGTDRAIFAQTGQEGPQARRRLARGLERDPLHRPRRMRLADAA